MAAKNKKVPFKRPPSTDQSDYIYGIIADNEVNDVNNNGESKRRKV